MSSCTFWEALEGRYGGEECEESPPEIILVGGGFPGRSSPTSGRRLLPRTLTLNRCGIDRAGQPGTELCPSRVEELDLAQNQLADLAEVDALLRHMPRLSFLNLSHNEGLESARPMPLSPMEGMRSLVLNHTHAPWDTVACFLQAMPNLQELHLSLNEYRSVELGRERRHGALRRLYLCGSRLSSWEQVVRLGEAFPALEALVAADTPLPCVPEPGGWEGRLGSLAALNLNNAPLARWEDVDRLNALRRLEDLRLQNIPLLDELSEPERRQHLIAYLPRVKRLNGSAITPKEREDAERAFIRHHLHRQPQDRPRRCGELEAVHGKLAPLVDVDLSPRKTARVFVNLCGGEALEVRLQRTPLTLDLRQSVQELKRELSGHFGLRPARMRLFHLDQELGEAHGPDELRYNGRRLYSYHIRDGDELLVDTK